MVFRSNISPKVRETRSRVVSISGRAPPNLESVRIPASLPVSASASIPTSRRAAVSSSTANLSPNDSR